MALLSIDEIIALEEGTTPTFPALNSMAQHVKGNQDDISALTAGSTPGWAAAIDTRWFLSATGTNAYSATPAGSPGAGDSLSDGLEWLIKFANAPTGACTLDLGTDDGAVALEKDDGSGGLEAIENGDFGTTQYYRVHYSAVASKFVISIPASAVAPVAANTVSSGTTTLTASNLKGVSHYIQPVDISANSPDVKLPPASAANKGKLVTVRVDTDDGADTSSRESRLLKSDDSEFHTQVRKGDFATVYSTGADWEMLGHQESHELHAALTSDQAISAGSEAQLTGFTLLRHFGSIFASDEVTLPFAAEAEITTYTIESINDIGARIKVGDPVSDLLNYVGQTNADGYSAAGASETNGLRTWPKTVLADGDKIQYHGFNHESDQTNSAYGNGSDQTQIKVTLRRLY